MVDNHNRTKVLVVNLAWDTPSQPHLHSKLISSKTLKEYTSTYILAKYHQKLSQNSALKLPKQKSSSLYSQKSKQARVVILAHNIPLGPNLQTVQIL